jgi:hypothetical protein
VEPNIHACTRDHVLSTWGSIVIVVYRVETTSEALRLLRPIVESLARQHPSGIHYLTIVEAGAREPSAEVRGAISSFFARSANAVKLSAVVFEGTGFRAAFVRSVASSIARFSRYPFPHRVFATVDAAVAWLRVLSPELDASTPSEFAEAVANVRSQVASRVGS